MCRHRKLRVEAHHRQAVELGGGDLAAHGEAVVRRAHHAHALVAQRPHLDAAPAARVRDDRSRRSPTHRAIDLLGALVVDADLDAGVARLEALLERLQQIDAGGVDRRHSTSPISAAAGALAVHRADSALEVVVAIDQLAALARTAHPRR